ncbi:MAG TPA: hypothetical protein PKJ26_04475 [Candidatus Woesebacteria bacterium]|nr:hypothetical protein [Candidatus Woesebacteria bacterium]HNS65724.1 hypothetical protein [Candidatus Woesebacteria bacterium]
MNKLLFVLALGILLSGCSLLPQKSSQVETPPLEQQVVKEYQKVADAMASGKSVECVMTNTQEGTSFTYQVKGNMVRSFGQLSPDSTSSGNMISDGTYLYMWSDDSAQGTKMKIPSETEVAEMTEQPDDVLPDLSNEEKQQELEDLGYSIKCDEKDLANDVFVPPTTIQFQDLSQMLESATQLQTEMESKASESTPELTQEQIEAMMKSFGDGE